MIRRNSAICLFLLLFAPLQAIADIIVTRTVSADTFSRPIRVGASANCPGSVARPASGDTVRLLLSRNMGRRDEPELSFIVRLDDKEALILYHGSRSFARFRFDPEDKKLARQFRTINGSSGAEFYAYQVEGVLQKSTGLANEREIESRAVTVNSPILGRLDVEVQLAPDAALGPAAFETEAFAQRVRSAGEQWLGALGPPDGIPLGISRALHQPSTVINYREEFSTLEEVELDRKEFLPPPGYSKITHDPDCI